MGWVLFAHDDMSKGWAFVKVLFGGGAGFVNSETVYQLLSALPLIAVCIVASTPAGKTLYKKMNEKYGNGTLLTADTIRVIGLAALSVAFLISGSYNPFLYFRF